MYLTAVLRDEDGHSLGVLVLSPKTFTSGRPGWFGTGKLEIGGVRYQCQAQAVEIRSVGEKDGL